MKTVHLQSLAREKGRMTYIILFLISSNVFANFLDKNKVGVCENGLPVYTNFKEGTIKIPNDYNCAYHVLQPDAVIKEDVETCTDENNCQEILSTKNCSTSGAQRYYSLEPNEVYCSYFSPEKVVENNTLKTAYIEAKTAKAAKEVAINQQVNYMSEGKRIYAAIMLINKARLTREQRKQMRSDLSEIRSDLFDGDLCGAREGVAAIQPDGTLITTEDKDAVLLMIDGVENCQ